MRGWNVVHIQENVELFDFTLSEEEMMKIGKLHKGVPRSARDERFVDVLFRLLLMQSQFLWK